jgi:mannose-6-phosphate isomerase-like protein (cupin superfamily)
MHDLSNLPDEPDAIAPDGSEIRLLNSPDSSSSTVHCRLQPDTTTIAVHHKTVEEQWECVAGKGELWRKSESGQSVLELTPGVRAEIPLGSIFQFRSSIDSTLDIVIITTPPWPGDDEAVQVEGKWNPRL